MSPKEKIEKELKKTIRNLFGIRLKEIVLECPQTPGHGDYASNFALKEFSKLKSSKRRSPAELAQEVADKLPKEKFLERIEVVPPGFINFHLKDSVFKKELKKILEQGKEYGNSSFDGKKTVIIDYSSPNIARPFSVGHLRSTIIGQAVYNLYKTRGYRVIGDNHLGDWGTQFGKLIFAVKNWGGKNPCSLTLKELVELYTLFHQKAKKNPAIEEKARFWFKELEQGNKEAVKIWKSCVKISQKEFKRIYKLLGIKIDYNYGESFYRDKIEALVEEAKELKIAQKSQGALIINLGKKMPPLMLLKSDKASTYHARDLAAIKFRQEKFGPLQRIIYEVGADQELHFNQLFSAAKKFPWGKNIDYLHLAHGLMRLPEGKISTRAGRVVLLEDILEEAIFRADKIVKKNNPKLSSKEKTKIAKSVGIGAVKYNDLSQHYSKDIVFNWEKMLNLEGNSAPYLQYSYARAASILRRGKISKKSLLSQNRLDLDLAPEKILLKRLYFFPEAIKRATQKHSPNLIANYLFQLAQEFNRFYELVPVIQKDQRLKKARLALAQATAIVLKNGLNILGIEAPPKM